MKQESEIEPQNLCRPRSILKSFNEDYEEPYQHNLSVLRQFLEEGHRIPFHADQSLFRKKQRNKLKDPEQLDSNNYSTTSNTSGKDQQWDYIDFKYVLECAQNNLVSTCEELLAFQQFQILQKLMKQYHPIEGNDRHPIGINQSDLLQNQRTRQMFMRYLQNKKKPNSRKKLDHKHQSNKQGLIAKIKHFFLTIFNFSNQKNNKNRRKAFQLLFMLAICLVLLILGSKYRQKIYSLIKLALNIQ